jgi:hypothetical protein
MAKESSIGANTTEAIWIHGDAESIFDLGSAAHPGNNILGASTTRLRISVAAGVTVRAVGNTWLGNAQGADAAGHYSTALCGGTSPCDVTNGTGFNYTFDGAGTGAALRLAE